VHDFETGVRASVRRMHVRSTAGFIFVPVWWHLSLHATGANTCRTDSQHEHVKTLKQYFFAIWDSIRVRSQASPFTPLPRYDTFSLLTIFDTRCLQLNAFEHEDHNEARSEFYFHEPPHSNYTRSPQRIIGMWSTRARHSSLKS